jgi:broad specificity phosphatase PhoE
MSRVKTIIAFRHGEYDRNVHIDRSHKDTKSKEYIEPENPDYTMDLNARGRSQIEHMRSKTGLARKAIDACFYSPFLRTETSARIALGGLDIPLLPEPALRERNLGRFATMPREQFHEEYAESLAEKRRTPLDWPSDFTDVETLRDVGRLRLLPLLDRIHQSFPGGTVAFATHADTMVAMRSLPELGAMTNEQLRQPLTSELDNPQWIQNAQLDMYTRENSDGSLSPEMRYFRSITLVDTQYDTGWLEIQR